MNKLIFKKINPQEYFNDIVIPDDWDSLESFVDWYLNSKMPMMIPYNAMSIVSDDAAAISIFRKGAYQVELYIIFPDMWIREHSHPDMEVIIVDLGGGSLTPKDNFNVSKHWGTVYKKISNNQPHGGGQGLQLSNGSAQLAFQKWENPKEMTSAAIQWVGEIQGPRQASLIKKFKDNVLITENYADITQKNS